MPDPKKTSPDKLAASLRHLDAAVCFVSSEGKVLFMTGAFALWCGDLPSALEGKMVEGILLPDDVMAIRRGIQKSDPAGVWKFSVQRPASGGRGTPYLLTVRKVASEEGALAGHIYAVTDPGKDSVSEKSKDACFRIVEEAGGAESQEGFFRAVHRIVASLMPANNFYIALYDPKTEMLSFPYFVDEVDPPAPPPQRPGKGLTEYVIRTGRPLLCTVEVHDQLVARGDAELIGAPSPAWLGVPLIADGETIGAMVVQHYSDPAAYGEKDTELLNFISSQVARSIEKKEAERHLRLSNQRYLHFMERSSEGIWRATVHPPVPTDLPLREQAKLLAERAYLTEGNTVMAQMSGLGHAGELVGLRLSNFFPPGGRSAGRGVMDEFVESGYTLNGATTAQEDRFGTSRHYLNNLIGIIEGGSLIDIWGTRQDVSEERTAELKMRESEEKYRALFESSQDAIFITSPDGDLIDVNAAAVGLFGCASKQELLAAGSALKFAEPGDATEIRKRMVREGSVENFECTIIRRDGEKRVGLFTSSPIHDARKAILGHRGYIRDITDRRRLEDQFRQAQKMEGIGTLAGGIAHDFNNLLGIILGFTQLLEAGQADPERFRKSIDTIKKAIERGSGLVRQLLTFARRADPSFHDMNLNEIVNEVAQMLQATFPKTITIETRVHETLPLVTADRAQLSQALLNLCVNARDAVELAHKGRTPMGKLTLTSGSVSGDTVRRRFPNALLEHYVAIAVTDDGAGMDAETRKRLFEPFFTTKELGKGSGLGLSVVYGVVNSHHGFIDVESQRGKGTTFTLYFPITEALHPSVVSLVDPAVKIAPGTETVLVVEDEEMLRDLLKTYLTGNGYTVLTAQDGEEGYELFKRHHRQISLVLSDMGLPRLGGWEMFRKMQELEPRVKAILASGYFDPNLKLDMVKAGAKDFIQKPYVPAVILQRIREVIDEKN